MAKCLLTIKPYDIAFGDIDRVIVIHQQIGD